VVVVVVGVVLELCCCVLSVYPHTTWADLQLTVALLLRTREVRGRGRANYVNELDEAIPTLVRPISTFAAARTRKEKRHAYAYVGPCHCRCEAV
jgi:hypothetical protein